MANSRDPWNPDPNSGNLDEHLSALFGRLRKWLGGGGSGNSGSSSGGSGRSLRRIFLYLPALIVVLYLLGGFYTLDAREQSVVLRFGKFEAVHQEGLNWRFLFIDSIYRENTTEVRNYRHEASMLTEDQNIVRVPITVQYVVRDIKNFVLNMDDPEHSLRLSTESSVRHVVGGSSMDNVLSVGREVIAAAIQTRLKRYQENYGSGIGIVKVNLLKGDPPQQVQADFVDVVRAAEDKERMRNEAESYSNRILPETRGEASRILQEAQAYRSRVVEHAKGDASRFGQQLSEYQKAPAITRQRLYLEAMEAVMSASSKIMIDDSGDGGGSLLYLPLDQLVSRTRDEELTPTSEADLRRLVEEALRSRQGAEDGNTRRSRR